MGDADSANMATIAPEKPNSQADPRARIEELLTACHRRDHDEEAEEKEILMLAKMHPEAFVADIVQQKDGEDRRFNRSPLNRLMGLKNRTPLSVETFEAVYSANPKALNELDSWGDTVFHELLLAVGQQRYHVRGSEKNFANLVFPLIKAVIGKSKQVLATNSSFDTPPLNQAIKSNLPDEIIWYMMDQYPGDPFQVQNRDGETLLAASVRNQRPFDFIKRILDGNPAAVRVQESDKYKCTVLHVACSGGREDVVRLLLDAYPQGAFVPARYKQLPLAALVEYGNFNESLLQRKACIEMMAMANPDAIFAKSISSYSAFSSLAFVKQGWGNEVIPNNTENAFVWQCLFFFMDIYRYKTINVSDAWKAPNFPLHMAASCPCPRRFLLHMANLHPEHLLHVDDQDRTVLALALEAGHSVHEKLNFGTSNLIGAIIELDNRILGLQDPKTRLFPFMTAACCEQRIVDNLILNDCFKCKTDASLHCLNTIYLLLRADPSKVATYLDDGLIISRKKRKF